MKSFELFFAGLVLGCGVGSTSYALIVDKYDFFTSPQECFINEIRNWSRESEISIERIEHDDANLMTSRLKVLIDESDSTDFDGDTTRIIRSAKAIADYCSLDISL